MVFQLLQFIVAVVHRALLQYHVYGVSTFSFLCCSVGRGRRVVGGPARLKASRFSACRGARQVRRNFQPTCGASGGSVGSKEELSPPMRGERGPGGFELPMRDKTDIFLSSFRLGRARLPKAPVSRRTRMPDVRALVQPRKVQLKRLDHGLRRRFFAASPSSTPNVDVVLLPCTTPLVAAGTCMLSMLLSRSVDPSRSCVSPPACVCAFAPWRSNGALLERCPHQVAPACGGACEER